MRCHPEMFQNTKMPSIFSCEVYLLPPHDGFKRDQPRPKSSAFIALYIGCIFSFSGFYSFRLVNLLSKRFRYTYIWICIYIYNNCIYIYTGIIYTETHVIMNTHIFIHTLYRSIHEILQSKALPPKHSCFRVVSLTSWDFCKTGKRFFHLGYQATQSSSVECGSGKLAWNRDLKVHGNCGDRFQPMISSLMS